MFKPKQLAAVLFISLGVSAQTVPTTKILAIGHVVAPLTPEQRRSIMPREVPDTVRLYLAGKIDQWYVRQDGKGVVFLLNVTTTEELTTFWRSSLWDKPSSWSLISCRSVRSTHCGSYLASHKKVLSKPPLAIHPLCFARKT